jgi:phosphoribosyl 1,2-cyclic phosphate phosphodiesterase
MKVTILGCGTSSGVPRIDGDWGRCDPNEPRNRRRRASVLIEHDDTRILVDTSPDLREQLLAEGGERPHAVIWTHEHADHCHGLDDLRPFYFDAHRPISGYARPRVADELQFRFAFAFAGHQGYPPFLRCDPLPDILHIGGIRVDACDLPHGAITSTGLRFSANGRSIAYYTDFNELTDKAQAMVEGVDLWIVDAVRRHPHPTHPHLDQTLGWIAACRPARAVLTHMDHSMDYRSLLGELPATVEPGFDTMEIAL